MEHGMKTAQEKLNMYCIKCKETKEVLEYAIKLSDSGRRVAHGHCPACNHSTRRILGQ